ncbi:MAG: NADH-quinone oxidoreductase subunit J [Euryarchaeota archaeon]|jgi:NADH:ubiquinone oxidoreductase subunit 6 (subunit J)|nr:NADH-quinone oxidoreductase subunit J [Euryarchaeota archaeon]MBT4982451.1 NADH-quinone oxidoreductase subunit J [Euryarchaeota archaeon]MBT5183836.1 NADH-quinone oxidoreductase subunit J [Euryarchaeota archaeon]
MRLLSILARVGLVFLGAVLVSAVSADIVWEDSSDKEITTSDLASALFGEWALPLLALGFLMAMAMVGAAYLVRDERLVNLEWELNGGEKE